MSTQPRLTDDEDVTLADIDEALANLIGTPRDDRAEYADKLLDLRLELADG